METIQEYLTEVEMAMEKAYVNTQYAFSKINIGRAVPTLVQDLMIEYYGNLTPLCQLATINTSDVQTLVIQPWEQNMIGNIEKAIKDSQLGLSTKNDGRVVIVSVPKPSEERRKNLVKLIKNEAEKGRIVVRNIRRDYKELMKTIQKEGIAEEEVKRAEKKLQKLTDDYIDKINQLLLLKEADLMKV